MFYIRFEANFPVGEMVCHSISITDDEIIELTQDFDVELANPSAGILGNPSSAVVTIFDDDLGNYPPPIQRHFTFLHDVLQLQQCC